MSAPGKTTPPRGGLRAPLRPASFESADSGPAERPTGIPADIPEGGWIGRYAPEAIGPYLRLARLDRPTGTFLLLFPCWWGAALAAHGAPDLRLMALFAVGALLMRAAGCTVNDIADRDIDARVARTRTRPIAAGQVPVPRALVFLGGLMAAGLLVLARFNRLTILTGLASLPLVFIYPFSKRLTHWPQAVLGLTFNWGALVGWTAVQGSLDAPALLLYAAGFFWTLGYDTIYAHQDREDDALVGVKSSALRLGRHTRPWLFIFYGTCVALMGLAGHAAGLGSAYFAGLTIAALQLLWQAGRVDLDDPNKCLAAFRSNTLFGWIVLAAIVAGQLAAQGAGGDFAFTIR
jgi:4-hydroxybenzoate polyprenyltransferase